MSFCGMSRRLEKARLAPFGCVTYPGTFPPSRRRWLAGLGEPGGETRGGGSRADGCSAGPRNGLGTVAVVQGCFPSFSIEPFNF